MPIGKSLQRFAVIALVFGSILGCERAPVPPGGTPAVGNACDTAEHAAREQVAQILVAHRECKNDADCVNLAVSTACFDACTKPINSAQQDEVLRAIVDASARQ